MWFLIKGSFWFGLVLVLLPIFDRGASDKLADGPKVEISDALSAATGAYDYISGLCTEKPDVCEKGGETVTALGHRAREGARIAYEFLDTKFGEDTARTAENLPAADLPAATNDGALPKIDDDVTTGTIAPLPLHKPAHR